MVLLIRNLAYNMDTAGEMESPGYLRILPQAAIMTWWVSFFSMRTVHTQFENDTVISDGTAFWMKKMVPVHLMHYFSGRLHPTPCDNKRPHLFQFYLSKMDASIPRMSFSREACFTVVGGVEERSAMWCA